MPTSQEIYDPPAEGKDYILQIKIKNGPLLRAMRIRGFRNAHQFCLKTGLHPTIVGQYLALKKAPISRKGKWYPSALALAKHLHLPPDCLFPEQHLHHALAKASGEIEISNDEVSALIDRNDSEFAEYREMLCSTVGKMMGCLTPREERVLRLRHGFDGELKTLGDVGDELGLSAGRVQQIEAMAHRKLKGHKNVKELADVGYAPADKILSEKRRADEQERKEFKEHKERQALEARR